MKKITLLFCAVLILNLGGMNFAQALTKTEPKIDGQASPGPKIDGSASAPSNTGFTALQNPLKAKSIQGLLVAVVDIAIFIGVIFAVLMFIFIGFKFIMAQGDGPKLKEARMWFLYAVIGTAVLISSKIIVEVVKNTFIAAGLVDQRQFNEPGK